MFDNAPPGSVIKNPENSGAYSSVKPLSTISGTAYDTNSLVDAVYVSIMEVETGNFFNGSSFTDGTTVYFTATGTGTWTYYDSDLSFVHPRHYIVRSYAVDEVGNTESLGSGNTFIYDTTKPLSNVNVPLNSVVLENPPFVSGDASDTHSGIKKVQVSIKKIDYDPQGSTPGGEDRYFDPGTWDPYQIFSFSASSELWLDAGGTTGWDYGTNNIWLSGYKYWVKSKAVDNGNNEEDNANIGNGNNFTVTLPATHLACHGVATPHTAGTLTTITVEALDRNNDIALSYNGTVSFDIDNDAGPETPGDGLPENYTFTEVDPGYHVFSSSFTLRKAAVRTIRVKDAADEDITPGTQSGIQVTPAAGVDVQVC